MPPRNHAHQQPTSHYNCRARTRLTQEYQNRASNFITVRYIFPITMNFSALVGILVSVSPPYTVPLIYLLDNYSFLLSSRRNFLPSNPRLESQIPIPASTEPAYVKMGVGVLARTTTKTSGRTFLASFFHGGPLFSWIEIFSTFLSIA